MVAFLRRFSFTPKRPLARQRQVGRGRRLGECKPARIQEVRTLKGRDSRTASVPAIGQAQQFHGTIPANP
jgi:hypothetical protein